MQAYAKQMQDRESLLAKCRAKDDEQIRAGSEFAHRINSRISDADLRRNLSIKSAQKKHRDHNDTVTLKNSVQHEIDQQNYEHKFGTNVQKGLEIKEKLRKLEEDNKLHSDDVLAKKTTILEKVNNNKYNEMDKVKRKNRQMARRDAEITQKIIQTRVKSDLEVKKVAEIKRLQNLDVMENRERDKMLNLMRHQAYFINQEKKQQSIAAMAQEIRNT